MARRENTDKMKMNREVVKFNNLREMIMKCGWGMGEEVTHRLHEVRKIQGSLRNLWKENTIPEEITKAVYRHWKLCAQE